MLRLTVYLLLCLSPVMTYAQPAFSAKKITTDKLPATLKYQGKPTEAWKWKDRQGDNILLLTRTAEHAVKSPEDSDEMYAAALYAYLFVRSDSGYKVSWKLTDLVTECPFDITLQFFKGAVSITDLDKDSLAEVTVLYKLSCRSDVSPDNMKLILREGADKYALRGLTCDPGTPQKSCVTADSLNLERMPKPADEWEQLTQRFGRYETEKEFANAPPTFLPFAKRQWLRYVAKTE